MAVIKTFVSVISQNGIYDDRLLFPDFRRRRKQTCVHKNKQQPWNPSKYLESVQELLLLPWKGKAILSLVQESSAVHILVRILSGQSFIDGSFWIAHTFIRFDSTPFHPDAFFDANGCPMGHQSTFTEIYITPCTHIDMSIYANRQWQSKCGK